MCTLTSYPSSTGKSVPNIAAICNRDISKLNFVHVVIVRCVTAKGARRFAEQHQHIKMKEILTGDDDCGPGFEGPFGQKTTL